MGQKCNQRSFRYSDEVAAILMGYGSTDSSVNDKFEQLVLDCNLRVPAIQQAIKREQDELDLLRAEYRELQQRVWNLKRYEHEMQNLQRGMINLQIALVDAAEKCNTDLLQLPGVSGQK